MPNMDYKLLVILLIVAVGVTADENRTFVIGPTAKYFLKDGQ
eukprot:gene24053-10154_t